MSTALPEQYELFNPTSRRRLDALFSQQTDEWETPQQLFAMLNHEFSFTLDACATKENAKCAAYYTKDTNGLSADWGKNVCWMNPPYSALNDWLHKAYESSQRGATVVCLPFARTDTKGFHEAVSHTQRRSASCADDSDSARQRTARRHRAVLSSFAQQRQPRQ